MHGLNRYTTSWQRRWRNTSGRSEAYLPTWVPHLSSIPFVFLVGILVLGTILTSSFTGLTASAHARQQAQSLKPAVNTEPLATSTIWYFAEGSVGNSFLEYITLFNPGATTATVSVTYLFQNGSPRAFTHTVNPRSRATVAVNTDLGISPNDPQQSISTIVRSTVPIVAERPMYFNFRGVPSGTDVLGATNANSSTFYFAEGEGSAGYSTFVSILNPSATDTAHVIIRYYSSGSRIGYQILDVGPMRRATSSPGSVGIRQSVAIQVESTIGIVVERPMYFSTTIPNAGGATTGAASAVGATSPDSDWLFAEGYTGPNFQEDLVLANFTYTDAIAQVKLEYTNGSTQTVPVTVRALSQAFFDVNNAFAHPLPGCTPTSEVSAEVTASTPSIVVERLMYFHFGGQRISGGTDVVGEVGPASHALYNFSEGYLTPTFSEFLTLQNPTGNAEAASITLFVNNTTVQETRQLPAHSRSTVDINGLVRSRIGTGNFEVSMSVQAQSGTIVAERPLYFILGGSQGGTDVIGYTGDPTANSSPCEPPPGVQPVSPDEIDVGNTAKKQVALTFDAGGDVAPASSILDTLNKRAVHATFFFTGVWAQQDPTLVKGVADGGYEIANHTMTHPDLTTIADVEGCRQLNQADQVISHISGRTTTRPYYRPPYGARTQHTRELAAHLGYRTVYWTIDTLDWQPDSTPERILQRILDQLTPGAIILMHAGSSSEAQAIDKVITTLHEKGYELVTMTEILQGT